MGELDEIIGDTGHCRNDRDNARAFPLRFNEALRDLVDALGVTHRRAAVFLDNQTHDQIARTLRWNPSARRTLSIFGGTGWKLSILSRSESGSRSEEHTSELQSRV